MASNATVSGGFLASKNPSTILSQAHRNLQGQNGLAANAIGPSRKKQKQKQKAPDSQQEDDGVMDERYIHPGHHEAGRERRHAAPSPEPRRLEVRHGVPQYDAVNSLAEYEEEAYSDEGFDPYDPVTPFDSAYPGRSDAQTHSKKKPKKKKKAKTAPLEPSRSTPYPTTLNPRPFAHPPPPPPPPPISHGALRTVQRRVKDPIWDTSTQEERSRIKEFWLSLGEEDRKSLVKIEKEAVLRKMKEQQRNSCSCTLCGRKRTAIEEELEVLYDAYYEELEQFANHNQELSENGLPMLEPSKRYGNTVSRVPLDQPPPASNPMRPSRGRIHELPDDEDELEDGDLDDQDYSDEDEYDDEDYSVDETDELPPNSATDFFTFGNSLTVKGGILTVADDLLKNDGHKFIDMMEQLAKRRMQREVEVSNYTPYSMPHQPPPAPHSHVPHTHAPPLEDEYDDEDEEVYDSQEDDYDAEEEEDEMDALTKEQRMEEGRRMFQIFAARMFEQRVLTAYREKVARERQDKLIQEVEAESLADSQRDAKKARDAEKKKQKKQQQKQVKAEEKARKEQQKAEEETAAREAETKRVEEQRQKREEQRKKKEAEKKAQEEEKQRKESEKQRRLNEEKERQQELERKGREQKAEEKRQREEAKRKEREEKEAQEQERHAQRLHAEKERREKEERMQADRELKARLQAQEQANQAAAAAAAADLAKRASIPALIAVPPALKSRQSTAGQPSPQPKVATPVLPKAPTPVRPKEVHSFVSRNSTPHTPESGPHSKQSGSPKSASTQHSVPSNNVPSRQTPVQQMPMPFFTHNSPMTATGPPPGMQHVPNLPFGGMPHASTNGFPQGQTVGSHGPMARAPQAHHAAMFPPQGPYPSHVHRPFMHGPTSNHPPGITANVFQPPNRTMLSEAAAGLPMSTPLAGVSTHVQSSLIPPRENLQGYQRPPSRPSGVAPLPDASSTQPISRPAPIKRPASNLNGKDSDINALSNRLGSSALLDDSDEPLPSLATDIRRAPVGPGLSTSMTTGFGSAAFDQAFARRSLPGDKWSTSSSTPFGAAGMNSAAGWGPSGPSTGWSNPAAAFHHASHRSTNPRPVTVRLLACHACRSLSSGRSGGGASAAAGFHEIGDVLRQADSQRTPNEPPVRMDELRNILDTEGDAHNGGGYFLVRGSRVKWEADDVTPAPGVRGGGAAMGLGEIGSPIANGNGLPPPATLGALGARGGY